MIGGENLELAEIKYNFLNTFKCAIFSVTSGEIYYIHKSKGE
jgi:hypothetical protein